MLSGIGAGMVRDIPQAEVPAVLRADSVPMPHWRCSLRGHHWKGDAIAAKKAECVGGSSAVLRSHGDMPWLAPA